jgi:hypothetical protein
MESLSVDALRDEDYKAYLASDSEPSDEDDVGEDEGRNKMRSLLGLNSDDENQTSKRSFGKNNSVAFEDGRKSREAGEGAKEMQITFMPGLSEAAERKKKGLRVDEPEEESTKDKYLRKQRERKERKKLQDRNIDEEEGLTKKKQSNNDTALGFDDPFFASDNEETFEAALRAEQGGRGKEQSDKKKPSSRIQEDDMVDAQDVVSREELALMVDSDSGGEDGKGHFSMKDILKAEQEGKGKKSRWAKKKEKRNPGNQRDQEVQENFAINVQDERFQGVFDDHRFALDPSHPSYLKTKNMDKIMEERRKRDKQRRKGPPATSTNGTDRSEMPRKESGNDLADLVKSVKKRSASEKTDRPSKKR